MRFLYDTMVRNGDGQKKIWLTEFGAPTGTAGNAVNDEQQAAIIAGGLSLARSLSYVGPLFVYEIRDAQTGSSDTEDNFGLLRTDRSGSLAASPPDHRPLVKTKSTEHGNNDRSSGTFCSTR